MGRTSVAARAQNLVVWLLTAGALALVVHERVLPWIRAAAIVDPGDAVPPEIRLTDASTGDSIPLVTDSPTLVIVFRSTCPACERALPGWRELARSGGWRVVAVGLEDRLKADAYLAPRLPEARLAFPSSVEEFNWRFRIEVVPTTLAIDREGRLAVRRAGPLEEGDLIGLRRLAASSAP